jgi:integrase
MTVLEIVDSLVARQSLFLEAKDPRKRQQDLLTSLRKLAAAFDITLEDIDLALIEATYQDTLKAYFASLSPVPSVHTQRNTLQNISQLYKAAYEAGVLRPLAAPTMKPARFAEARRRFLETSPYRTRSMKVLGGYGVPKAQWPADIRVTWESYAADKQFEIRDATWGKYDRTLSRYVSYNLQFDPSPIMTWDQLFETARLRRFIQWHAARMDQGWTKEKGTLPPKKTRVTRVGDETVGVVVMLARALKRPETEALKAFRSKLPAVQSWHVKTAPVHAVTLQELESIGLQLLADARRPLGWWANIAQRPGLKRAITFQNALLIRLWWRVPIRSRSMRELDITLPGQSGEDARLYQDNAGVWQLRYQGEQLKIGERRGKPNEFRVPFPPDLVSHLEEYLRDFRPRIPNAGNDPHLFLGANGRPLSSAAIWGRLAYTVYRYLGRRIYPHLLRTLWTDTYLLTSNGDIDTAAYMLNDTPTTVLQHYHELRADQQVSKAYAFNQAILGNGNGQGKKPKAS